MTIFLTEYIEIKALKWMVITSLYFSGGINTSAKIKSSKILDLGLKHLFYLDILNINKIYLKLEIFINCLCYLFISCS